MADRDLDNAVELMGNFWQREPVDNAYGEIDPQIDAICRIAELLSVIAHASISIARSLDRRA